MHEALGVGRAPDPGQVVALHSHSAPSRPAPEPSSMATEPSRRRRPRLPAAPAAHDRLMLEVDARDPGLVGQAVRTSGSRVRLRLRLPEAMTLSPRIRLSVRLGRDTWIQLRGRVARQDGRRLSIECHDVPEDDLWLLTRTPRRSA